MEKPLNNPELSEALIDKSTEVIEEVFREEAPMLLENAGNIEESSDKPDGSPVTKFDIAVEEKLKKVFKDKKIGIPVFGEEAGYDADKLPETCWLVDPVDGTKSFIKGEPAFTNMAVLIHTGEAMASVIYNPSTDEMFVAKKGRGTYKNGVRIDLAAFKMPSKALCKSELVSDLEEILRPAEIKCFDGPSGGGFGFTTVLNGLTAARFNLRGRGYTHDYAPGALLVAEAGGKIIQIKGNFYDFKSRSFVACHPKLAPIILEQLDKIRALEN